VRKIFIISIFVLIISIFLGPAGIRKEIILDLRIPRVLMGFFVGASLSLSGLSLQTIFKNPLLEPYLIGISSGGALFSFLSYLIPFDFILKTPLFSFFGSILSVTIILSISRFSKYNPYSILLLGISISILFSSILAFLIYIFHSERIQIFFYLFGSLSRSSWLKLSITFFLFIFSFIFLLIKNKELDIILLQEEEAFSLGVNPQKFYIEIIFFSSILASISVAFNGIIGFIGLIVPHISRILIGEKHKNLIPFSSILGGVILVLCDDLSRILIKGIEIPIGIITSFIGVPFFIYLLFKKL